MRFTLSPSRTSSGGMNNSRKVGNKCEYVKVVRLGWRTSCFQRSLPTRVRNRRSAVSSTCPWWIATGFFFPGDTRNEKWAKTKQKKKSQLGLHDGCFPSQSVRRSHADRQDANCKSLWNVMTGRHAPRDETWLFAGVKPEADKKAFEAPIVLGASC